MYRYLHTFIILFASACLTSGHVSDQKLMLEDYGIYFDDGTIIDRELDKKSTSGIKTTTDPLVVCQSTDVPCSGLMTPDTLIRDNSRQQLRCHDESETYVQTVPQRV